MNNESHCFEKIKHDCGSTTNSLQTYYNANSDSYTGYCFSCSTFVPSPYGETKPKAPKVKTHEEVYQDVQEVRQLPTVPTAFRVTSPKTYAKFGVRYAVSEFDGKSPHSVNYPYTEKGKLVGWKVRLLQKKMFYSIGNISNCDPFGYVQALKNGAKRCYITSGEEDALALDMILTFTNAGTKYASTKYSIVSVPKGEGSIASTIKALSKFDELCFIPDSDGAGEEAVKKAVSIDPNILIHNMPLGYKDPSDLIQSKKKDEIKKFGQSLIFNSKKEKTAGVVSISDILKRGLEKPVMGLSYPWSALTELTLGQRFGECVAIGGGVGTGKTALAHMIAAHNLTEHDEGTFMVLLEETNQDTLRNVAGKIDGELYHRPDVEYSESDLLATAGRMDGKILLWDDQGTSVDRFDMDEIIKAIRFNAIEYGTRFVVIDNMTCIVSALEASEANSFINRYSSKLAALAIELDLHIDIYSHLNPPQKGASHEQGGEVLESQFTGSRGMMRAFSLMIGFARNKYEESNAKHNSIISIIKARKFGETGRIKTKYATDTGRLIQSEWEGTLQKPE